MSFIDSRGFLAPSERDLKRFINDKGQYVPSPKQLGISQSAFDAMNDSVRTSTIDYYNAWLVQALAEKRRKKEARLNEKGLHHWWFKLDDEKKRDLLIRTLNLKTSILVKRMMSKGAGEQSQRIYQQAEKAEAHNFKMKPMSPSQAVKCLPYYDEEEDCLFGGDNKFIYCWLKFFPSAPKEKKKINMAR